MQFGKITIIALFALLMLGGTVTAVNSAPSQTNYYTNSTYLYNPNAIATSGNYLYIVSGMGYSLTTFDITGTNASAPVYASMYSNTTSINIPYAIVTNGNYIYVGTYTGKSITTFDKAGANASAPVQTNFYSNTTSLNGVYALAAAGNYVYAGTVTGKSITTFDVAGANASVPVQTNYYNNSTSLNQVYAMSIKGNYLYAVSSAGKSLTTFDITGTNASAPVQTNFYNNTTSLDAPRSLAISGNYIYVLSYTGKSLTTFDITGTNASAPVQTNYYNNATSLNNPLGAASSSGGYTYVAGYTGNSITTFNIAGANAAIPAQTAYYSNATSLNGADGMVISGNYTYIISTNGYSLTTFDISPPKPPDACGALDTANTVYTLTGNMASSGTCFTVTAHNVTLNCNGYSITGANASSSIAISDTSYNNLTVKNCIISNYSSGIYVRTAADITMMNNTINTTFATTGYAIYLWTVNRATITGISAYTQSAPSIFMRAGVTNSTIANSNFKGLSSVYGVIGTFDGTLASSNITVANNTIDGSGGGYAMAFKGAGYGWIDSLIINNTIKNATTLVWFDDHGTGNTLCLNNFSNDGTATPTYYVNDGQMLNFYNCTYAAKNQGNIWADAANITGTVQSSITGYYIGSAGTGLPYNKTKSARFLCSSGANCQDYVALTTTLGNVAPVMNTSRIAPSPAYKSSTLQGYCNATDADTNNVTYYFKWFLNGAVNTTGTFASSAPAVERNVGNISSALLAKGQNWTLECKPDDGTVNGTATNTSALTISNSAPTQAYAITFVNSTTNHTFTATSGASDADGAADITASNTSSSAGTGVQISNASAGNNFNATFRYTPTVPATATVTMGYTDASGAYLAINGASNAYPDHAASLTQPYITPANASIQSDLTCNAGNFSDADNDTENTTARTWAWYKNGAVIAGQTTTALTSGNFTGGDNISCSENTTNSTWTASYAYNMSNNVTIQYPPVLSAIIFSPAVLYTNTALISCLFNITDADSANGTFSVNWYNNSVNQTALATGGTWANGSLINSSVGGVTMTRGDVWNCSITATDGGAVITAFSNNSTVVNSAPVEATSRITPTTAYVNSTLIGYCNATDADGDNVTHYFRWFKNGAINTTGTFNSSTQAIERNVGNVTGLTAGQNWTLECKAGDGTINGTALNSSVKYINNSLPIIAYQLNFTNATGIISFNVSAGIYDEDGGSTITATNISTDAGACAYLTNSTTGNYFNATYNCTSPTEGVPANITIGFTDNLGAYVQTNASINSYPYLPTVSAGANGYDYAQGGWVIQNTTQNGTASIVPAMADDALFHIATNFERWLKDSTFGITNALLAFAIVLLWLKIGKGGKK